MGVFLFSFGDPGPYIDEAKEGGAAIVCQVQTLEGARAALDAGADVLIAQGNEAGGHSGYLNTLPCLSLILELAGGTPVLAAGGVADGRSLAAVLAAGADGAMLGTAFLATPEAVEVADAYKELIVGSDGQDTVFTRVYDIVSGAPWPAGIGDRVRVNSLTRQWHGREGELGAKREEILPQLTAAERRGDYETAALRMGQSAGMVKAVRPAAEVIGMICDDAERLLRERTKALLG